MICPFKCWVGLLQRDLGAVCGQWGPGLCLVLQLSSSQWFASITVVSLSNYPLCLKLSKSNFRA